MRLRLVVLATLILAACSSSSSSPSGPPTGTGGHSCAQYTLCTKSGNTFTCDCGGGPTPACPSTSSLMQGQVCAAASTPPCMTCTDPGTMSATIICSCQSGSDGGLAWSCIGGEQACSD